jgi:hypothetical protein
MTIDEIRKAVDAGKEPIYSQAWWQEACRTLLRVVDNGLVVSKSPDYILVSDDKGWNRIDRV